MSFESANWWSDAANMVLVASLVAGVLATFVIVRTSARKEWFWEQDRKNAKVKVLELEKAADEARTEAAKAQLALAKYRAPRTLPPEGAALLTEWLKPYKGQKYEGRVASGMADAYPLWVMIDKALSEAGWERVEPSTLVRVGAPLAGVDEYPMSNVMIDFGSTELKERVESLTRAILQASEFVVGYAVDPNKKIRPDVIVIHIGLRPL